jgi:geranylgeranyl diphosphate synthase, type II
VSVIDPLDRWLDARRALVEAALDRALTPSGGAPAGVLEVMRYSVFAGGKRLRPLLVLAAAEAVAHRQGTDERAAQDVALPAACAVELIHTYSLVHDDLPAMDNDTLRRGRPTAHVVYGEGAAILAGDALLTEAFAVLARAGGGPADVPGRRLAAVLEIAEAAGAAGMVGGQALDLEAAQPGAAPFDTARLQDMHARKTGALLTASAVAGALLAGGTPAQIAAIRHYGVQVGLAFQIVDDILDVEGESAVLGKTAGKDAAAGKPTYPALLGLEESRRRAAACVDAALGALTAVELGGQLPAIARWIVSRTH